MPSKGVRLVLSVFCVAMGSLWAQSEAVSARLAGTVLDADEAAVPGARVTLSSPDTGFRRQLISGVDGRYVFALIRPGLYELKVEKEGFHTYLRPSMVLAVGQSSNLDPRLEVGAITEVIEVAADAPLLNAGNANIGWEVSTKQVIELPLNLRNVFSLTLLNSSVNNGHEYQGLT